jgi:hypothetical protein
MWADENFHNLLVDGRKKYNPPLHGPKKSITILFLDDVHDLNVMEWSRPCPLFWAHYLAGALCNIMGRGLTIP